MASMASAPTTSAAASNLSTSRKGGFTQASARKWVLTAALVTALVYAVRHLVEGETSPAPATNAARQFLGQGQAPNFGQWAIAYGVSFLGLSLLTVAAPELAAAMAILYLTVVFLESGGQVAKDLTNLEGGAAGSGSTQNAASVLALSQADQAKMFASQNFPLAPAPAQIWSGIGNKILHPNVAPGGKTTSAPAVPPKNGGIVGTYNPLTGMFN